MTPSRSALVVAAWLALAPLALAGSPEERASAHVADVTSRLIPYLATSAPAPAVRVVERAAGFAGVIEGELEISTGLLSMLDSDAQLAMIVSYELCRAAPAEIRREGGRGSSTAAQIGRAAVTGAAIGAVAEGVYEATESASPIVQGAVTGAATASVGVAVHAAMTPRRGSRSADAADDRAAADGMRALVAAGWDGTDALRAWTRLAPLASLGGEDGGYADAKANERRRTVAAKALRGTGQRTGPQSGHAVGNEAYRSEVRAGLSGWRFAVTPGAEPAPEGAESDASRPAPAGPPAWIVYRRSGGFTGWSAELRIGDDGAVWVHESQRADAAGPRAPLPPERLDALRRLVSAASARPPRQATPEARWLRDGQVRSLEVPSPQGRKSITLSDGMTLFDEDHDLVRMLEDLI